MFGFFKKKGFYFVSFVGFDKDHKPITYHSITRSIAEEDLYKNSFEYCRKYAQSYNRNVVNVLVVSFNKI